MEKQEAGKGKEQKEEGGREATLGAKTSRGLWHFQLLSATLPSTRRIRPGWDLKDGARGAELITPAQPRQDQRTPK